MEASNVNKLYSFDWLNAGKGKKELVQKVYKAFMGLFLCEDHISFVKVKGGNILKDKLEVEIHHYKDRKRTTTEMELVFSAKEVLEVFEILRELSSPTTEFLDEEKRYKAYLSGSNEYFEFNIFDKQFIGTQRLLETGFLTDDFLDYAAEKIFEGKKMVVYGMIGSGKTTMLEVLSELMQDLLLLVFQTQQEIRNNNNTIVRVNYSEINQSSEVDKHFFSLFKLDPDYIILDDPQDDLMNKSTLTDIFPYIVSRHASSYEEVVKRSKLGAIGGQSWSDTAEVFIGVESMTGGNFRIKEVREVDPAGDSTIIFEYNPDTDWTDKL